MQMKPGYSEDFCNRLALLYYRKFDCAGATWC